MTEVSKEEEANRYRTISGRIPQKYVSQLQKYDISVLIQKKCLNIAYGKIIEKRIHTKML